MRLSRVATKVAVAQLVFLGCLCGAAARDATILIGETAASSRYAASASDPVDIIIDFGEGLEFGDRVHVYLPLFRGASNTFGTFSASAATEHPSPANPRQNGLIARNFDQEFDAGLTSAFWDAPTETLRLVIGAENVSSVMLDSKYLRVGIAPSGRPNGKGPLPPAGGVRERWWYSTANFRVYSASSCSGAAAGRPGFPPEVCSTQDSQKTFTAAGSSKVSTAGTRLFVHPQLGEAGTFEAPHFSYAVVQGSATGMGETNCLTVSLVPSVSIMSDAASPAQITIGGLTTSEAQGLQESGDLQLFASQTLCVAGIASMSKDLSGVFQTPAATPQPNRASWNKDRGEVVLQLQPGRYLQAFQVLSLTFQLTNPSWLETDRIPTVAASGRYCNQEHHFCADAASSAALAIAPTPVQAARHVLGTELNQFDWRVIWQSTADPDVLAALHVTLSPNVDIRDENLVITNLCAPLSTASAVNLTSNRDNFGDRVNGVHPIELGSPDKSVADPVADWAADEETLTIKVGSVGLEAGQMYAAVITFQTPTTPAPVCVPLIRTANIRAQYMSTETLGVINPPRMNTFLIGQSSARPGQLNYLCVTLSPNSDMASSAAAASEITIAGLTGSLTPSTSSGQLYSCPRKLTDKRIDRAGLAPLAGSRYANDGFRFDQDKGEVVVAVAPGSRLVKASEALFAIPLRNSVPTETTACAAPTLEVSGSFTQGPVAFPAAPASKRALEGGREDGDVCAMLVHRPQFTSRVISHMSSVSGAANQILVTLRANFDVAATGTTPATITIAGLTGSATPSNTNFLSAITSVSQRNFVRFSAAGWDQTTGTLTLTLSTAVADCPVPPEENKGGGTGAGNDCMRADYPYSFAIALQNPTDPQEPPAEVMVSGQASIGGEVSAVTPEVMATASRKELKPLFVPPVGESFRTVSLGQTDARPGALNTICVTFSVWNAVPAGQASLTISGLTGFDTTLGPNLNMYGGPRLAALAEGVAGKFLSEAGGEANQMKWDATTGTLSAVLAADQALAPNLNSTLCVVLHNPASPRPCHASTKVELALAAESKTLAMDGAAMGIAHPACVGFVETVRFPLASLRHSTNATRAVATLMIELEANVPVATGTITLSGMYGYKRIGEKVMGKIPIEVSKNGVVDTATLEPEADWDGVSKLVLTLKSDGPGLQPAVTVPMGSATARAADVVVVKLLMRNGDQQAPYEVSVAASEHRMMPWAVDVGPETARLNVVVVPTGMCFTYNDWLANGNPDNGVSVAFSDGPDAARVVLAAEAAFPEWLTICGEEQAPNTEATLRPDWPFTRQHLSSTVLKLDVPARNADDPAGIPLLVQSSVLRAVDPEVVPDIERSRRRLLSACPPGYETRLIPIGAPVEAACDCPSECSDRASCTVRGSGEFGAFLLKEELCAAPDSVESNAGKIVAIVAAIFVVIVALTLFYLWRTFPELFEKQPEEDDKVAIDVPGGSGSTTPPSDTAKPQRIPTPPSDTQPPASRDVMLMPAEQLPPAPTPVAYPPAMAPATSGLAVPGIQDMDAEHVPADAPNHLHAFSNQELARGGLIEGHIPAPGLSPTAGPIPTPGQVAPFYPNAGAPAMAPNGMMMAPNGMPMAPNGMPMPTNGMPMPTNGMMMAPNGMMMAPNGMMMAPGVQTMPYGAPQEMPAAPPVPPAPALNVNYDEQSGYA